MTISLVTPNSILLWTCLLNLLEDHEISNVKIIKYISERLNSNRMDKMQSLSKYFALNSNSWD